MTSRNAVSASALDAAAPAGHANPFEVRSTVYVVPPARLRSP
eukprot:CAMPEP_0178713410 /NCGR_PEP_ID=MMETSP0699-20121125/19401_1 /TAXON_ID=265572 /ORGANISM="Extubocellulus spinifer, Strain CCMP396" /LENGTH=41 /DNA_ID= /DNA_START= /DNA_END= /DNA_ORIENTATION=